MKALKKFTLKDIILNDNEMKSIQGGNDVYNCTRYKENEDGSKTVFTFSTEAENVAGSWADFWNATGDWNATCFKKTNSNIYYA